VWWGGRYEVYLKWKVFGLRKSDEMKKGNGNGNIGCEVVG